jgi:two-component system sensor kinase FixL
MWAVSHRHLTVKVFARDDGLQQVSIADTGTGIAPRIAATLFKPFVTSKVDGMGVGLSISRSIIEAHGGRLWAEANPAGGSIFHFTVAASVAPNSLEFERIRTRRADDLPG